MGEMEAGYDDNTATRTTLIPFHPCPGWSSSSKLYCHLTAVMVILTLLTWDAIMTAIRLLSIRSKLSLPSITRCPPHLTRQAAGHAISTATKTAPPRHQHRDRKHQRKKTPYQTKHQVTKTASTPSKKNKLQNQERKNKLQHQVKKTNSKHQVKKTISSEQTDITRLPPPTSGKTYENKSKRLNGSSQ